MKYAYFIFGSSNTKGIHVTDSNMHLFSYWLMGLYFLLYYNWFVLFKYSIIVSLPTCCFVTLKYILMACLWSYVNVPTVAKIFKSHDTYLPNWGQTMRCSASCLSFHPINKSPFCNIVFLASWLKWGLKHSPSELYLLSSWDYRCKLSCPAWGWVN
jgi:hypothetical protein